MESAELKTNKRIRHCYPRSEVYHRWVHSEELVYHNKYNAVWGKYNWLMASWSPAKKATEKDIAESWGYHRSHCVAVIDRDKKKVLIRQNWKHHSCDVRRAISDDYEIFLTDEEIPTPYILKDEEELCKLHIKYLIEHFTEWNLAQCYNYLAGRTKKINVHVDAILSEDNHQYKQIKDFIRKYHLRKYPWSKISLNEKYKIRSSNREWWKSVEHPIPTINKIYSGKLFTKTELRKLAIGYFYSQHCYGNGIPLKDAEELYDKNYNYLSIKEYCNRRHISLFHLEEDKRDVYDSFPNWIKRIVEANNKAAYAIWQSNIEQSDKNRKEALAKMEELRNRVYTIADWRERKLCPSSNNRISYRTFVTTGRNKGQWVDSSIGFNSNTIFNRIQLRLSKDGKNRIETSRGATVTLEDGIKMFKLFNKEVTTNKLITGRKDYCNVNVGLYNLRYISYEKRPTEDYKDWRIQIGCHDLWLTEIIDFIVYYDLEDKFGLPEYPKTNYLTNNYYESTQMSTLR